MVEDSGKEPPLQLTARLADAVSLAQELHGGQTRKGTDVPYISHLLAVASLVLEADGDEDEAIAALLHDGPEDCAGEQTLEQIRRRFGDRVARIVASCSDTMESPKPAWRRRKERYLEHLRTADPSTLLVSLADKVHNARSILFDYRRLGEALWERFNAPQKHPDRATTRRSLLWYYSALGKTFTEVAPPSLRPLAEELVRTVNQLHEEVRCHLGEEGPASEVAGHGS